MKSWMTTSVLALSAMLTLHAAEEPNTLTAEEKAAGWTLLFDGRTTDGWRGYNQESVPDGWTVVDGALTLSGERAGDIITTAQYENFDFTFEWRISPNGNSGVFYLVQEKPELKQTYHSGPEYQILDNDGHPDAKNGGDRLAGANYALNAPSENTARPVGQWNQSRIVKNGAHVEHWLNGVKVVEYELWSPEWKALVAKSKFNEMPQYGKAKKGHLALQDHGDEVAYRNLKVRVLPAGQSTN